MYCTSRSISIYYIFFRMQGITPETGGLQNDNANTLKKKKKNTAPPMLRATNIQELLAKTPKHQGHATGSCSEQCFASTHERRQDRVTVGKTMNSDKWGICSIPTLYPSTRVLGLLPNSSRHLRASVTTSPSPSSLSSSSDSMLRSAISVTI
jgi:hypothetical protein